VWSCIYCGDTTGPFSKEHAFPFGLGGNFILPRASCENCRQKTKSFEETCLRRMFGAFRIRLNLPTQNPDQRPGTLPLAIRSRDGIEEMVEVPASGHPSAAGFPVYPQPRILLGLNATDTDELKSVKIIVPGLKQLHAMQQKLGQDMGIRVGAIYQLEFAKLLAKSVHACCFGEFRGVPEGFRLLLPPLIVGEPTSFGHLVGCASEEIPEPEPGMPHKIVINDVQLNDHHYIYADLRLFAFLPTPVYRVVYAERSLKNG
jgi:hypothetical protein